MQWLQDVIGGPRECLAVDSAAAYEAWARRVRMGMRLPAALTRSRAPVAAHVSDSRWVVDCPCGSAALASVEWGIGICADCGTIHPVTFPRDRAAVEEALLARPSPQHRHYFPHETDAAKRGLPAPETLASLRRENTARGVRPRGTED